MKADITARMEWVEGERFTATVGDQQMDVDGETATGASPMQHLLLALGGCMGIDIAHILEKMRTAPEAMALDLAGERAEDPPRRYVRITMLLRIEGDVPLKNIERAVQLSRDRYCSVWQSLAPDTIFDVDVELRPTRSA